MNPRLTLGRNVKHRVVTHHQLDPNVRSVYKDYMDFVYGGFKPKDLKNAGLILEFIKYMEAQGTYINLENKGRWEGY